MKMAKLLSLCIYFPFMRMTFNKKSCQQVLKHPKKNNLPYYLTLTKSYSLRLEHDFQIVNMLFEKVYYRGNKLRQILSWFKIQCLAF